MTEVMGLSVTSPSLGLLRPSGVIRSRLRGWLTGNPSIPTLVAVMDMETNTDRSQKTLPAFLPRLKSWVSSLPKL